MVTLFLSYEMEVSNLFDTLVSGCYLHDKLASKRFSTQNVKPLAVTPLLNINPLKPQ